MKEDRVPCGLESVSFLPRQARLSQFIRLGRGSLCTPLFGILWFSTARTQQSCPLHHFLASISLVGVASSWATNEAADGIVLVWAVNDRAEDWSRFPIPPKLNGGSLKIAPERLYESGSRRLCRRLPERAPLALTSTTRPLRAASQGLHSGVPGPVHTGSEVGYIFKLRVSCVVGPYDLSIPGYASGWWLHCLYLASLFSTLLCIPRISFHRLSVFHPLELRQNDRRSPGRTNTPSTRIPHPTTLGSVKVSEPHWATCHTCRESTWLTPTRGVEPHETCLTNSTELTRYGNDRGSLKKAFRHTETGLMKVQPQKTFGGMVATFGFAQQ